MVGLVLFVDVTMIRRHTSYANAATASAFGIWLSIGLEFNTSTLQLGMPLMMVKLAGTTWS
jgi:hypothetical protein